jgi:rubrerythrin
MGNEPMSVFVFGCVSCGKTVAGNEPSCPRCGASFAGIMFECPFCGELVSPIQRKCETCGTEFRSFSEEVSETSAVDLDGVASSVKDEQVVPPETKPVEQKMDEPRPGESRQTVVEFECPLCGKSVMENDTKCPHCGALFQ